MNRIEKSKALYQKGYNCAQAVVCAYADLFGADEETAFKISEGFGGGGGGMGTGLCGAMAAVYMLAGLKNSGGGEKITKKETYAQVRRLAEQFEKKNGSLICSELKRGVLASNPCLVCVEDAARLAEALLAVG